MSKYDGHTPGPWEWLPDEWWGGFSGLYGPENEEVFIMCTANDGDTGASWIEFANKADKQLLQDAPALLAENERLTSENERLRTALGNLLLACEEVDDLDMDIFGLPYDRAMAALAKGDTDD